MKKVDGFWWPDWAEEAEKRADKGHLLENLYNALEYVENFGVAIDGGAHIGIYTRILAEKFDIVNAFEPDPDNFECLLANTDDLDNVFCINMALGPEQYCDVIRTKASVSTEMIAGGAIPMIPLRISADFVKLDIEGYEYSVLENYLKEDRQKTVFMVEEKGKGPSCDPLFDDFKRISVGRPDFVYIKDI